MFFLPVAVSRPALELPSIRIPFFLIEQNSGPLKKASDELAFVERTVCPSELSFSVLAALFIVAFVASLVALFLSKARGRFIGPSAFVPEPCRFVQVDPFFLTETLEVAPVGKDNESTLETDGKVLRESSLKVACEFVSVLELVNDAFADGVWFWSLLQVHVDEIKGVPGPINFRLTEFSLFGWE